jgi:hypothetical protein
MAAFFLAFLITGLSWFATMYLKGHGSVIKEFIDYQVRLFNTEDSDHGGPFIYHFVVLLIGCFPSSLFLILAHKKSNEDTPYQKHTKRWMMSLFWVVLILFSIVQTKIVHYSSLCYFPLTYLATYGIQKLLSSQYQWKKWFHGLFVIVSTLLGLAFLLLGSVPILKPWLITSNIIGDQFAIENLKANVCWSGYEWLIGIVFMGLSHFSLAKIKTGSFKFIYVLFLASLVAISSLLMIVVPKIEQYSQRAAIEFYKQCAKHGYNVETIGLKSYATLFYGELDATFKNDVSFKNYIELNREELNTQHINIEVSYGLIRTHWLMDGYGKKPACFVAKINDEEVVKRDCPFLQELYRQNGFIFYMRKLGKK